MVKSTVSKLLEIDMMLGMCVSFRMLEDEKIRHKAELENNLTKIQVKAN